MSRRLTPDSSLETLRKEAKRWLRDLRAGDAEARQRLAAALPAAPAMPGLRDVQWALAREHGLPGWPALREALADLALARRSLAEQAEILLRSAWEGDPVAAARLLARSPELRAHSLYTSVATGDRAAVERRLATDPAAAGRKGGPLGWEPLLYLAYARLPGGDAEALAIARMLLDRGADPNAGFSDGWDNPFTVLTGVIGEGEGDKPPHPQAAALATLLIERGADPYDTQALYNTSITRDDTTWLEFLWRHCESRGRTADWLAEPSKLGGRVPMAAIDYLLGNAVAYNHVRRAEWLLAHGAKADGVHAYSGSPLREEALTYGHAAMANLLERHGAAAAPLEGLAGFRAACMRLDRDAAQALAAQHPECLQDAWTMLTAARQGRADVVALLLELGVDVDVCDATEQRGLHNAVASGAMEVAKLLIAGGADIDRPTTQFGGPLGFAAHFGRRDMAELLAPLSRDVLDLTWLGMTERLRALLTAEPGLANHADPRAGVTPLFTLPDDEDMAVEMAELLLAHGADPSLTNKDGLTAEQVARRRGLVDAAELMHGGGAASG
ncbi:ankyrin repeat domain-containing protein [Roseomonas hellenica]|uniref:Ankyrin repeat domain-containing protein n=1 Tax=Plastoroseomonas hellenica TaxID=2687306 RepID=A0ABS5F252_9PROT|nr:ankyrin repeat domain-containing protein [Plastoroseomonas hellenica]MBR0666627.1 ankyrin repeat domain-containing protein [Plastoroseomonas hellenica]